MCCTLICIYGVGSHWLRGTEPDSATLANFKSFAELVSKCVGSSPLRPLNTQGKFEAKLARLVPGGAIKTQKANFDSTMQLRPDGNFKLSYAPLITPWQNGDAEYHESDEIVSFDGKTIVSFTSRNGPLGKATPYKVAHILKSVPESTTYGYENGRLPFLAFWKLFHKLPLAELIANPAALFSKVKPEILVSEVAGNPTFTFGVKDPKSGTEIKEIFTFRASPEVALLSIRREIIYAGSSTLPSIVEAKFENHLKLADGLVVPKRTTLTVTSGGITDVDATVDLDKVVWVEPDRVADAFLQQIPEGTTVIDDRFNTRFIVAPPPDAVLKDIQQKVLIDK